MISDHVHMKNLINYQMIVYVADIVKKNITKIRIVSNDTDIVVISLAFLSNYQFRRTLDYFRNRKIQTLHPYPHYC